MQTTADCVRAKLKEYGSLVRENLPSYLPAKEPRAFLYSLISDYPSRGGKMMRPSLCIAAARAFGARAEDALCSAIAIELFHNALLVHDDIQDGSKVRRGRPTLHELHGVPLALNVGSTMLLLSLRPLLDNARGIGPLLAARILEETARVAQESAEGQALELGWCKHNTMCLRDADYLVMVLKKTCWLATIYPTRVGALIGTRGGIDLDRFVRFGFFLGAAFQIQDDVLNLIGDPLQYGKELGGDLWEGKRSLILIRLFTLMQHSETERVRQLLETPREQKLESEVRYLYDRILHYDCIDYARRAAAALAGAAEHEFHRAFGHLPDSEDKSFLLGLCHWVFEQKS